MKLKEISSASDQHTTTQVLCSPAGHLNARIGCRTSMSSVIVFHPELLAASLVYGSLVRAGVLIT